MEIRGVLVTCFIMFMIKELYLIDEYYYYVDADSYILNIN